MKTIAASEVRANLEAVLGSAQKERIVVTRGGKPSAVLFGIESYDDEDLQLVHSEVFWRLIQSRRQGRAMPLSELRTRLKIEKATPQARGGPKSSVKGSPKSHSAGRRTKK